MTAPPPPSTDIRSAAQACIDSYASAMHLSHSSPPTPTPAVASALAAHYLPGLTSFTFGNIAAFPDAAASAIIQQHLERFEGAGVGYDIRLEKSRIQLIEGVSGSALCFITWRIFPRKGEGWEWENCYFYRRKGDGRVGWEGVISDAEIQGALEHIPEAFAGLMGV